MSKQEQQAATGVAATAGASILLVDNDRPLGLNLRDGVTDAYLVSTLGRGYYVSMCNTGALVVRSESTARVVMFTIEDLVNIAIGGGIDGVQP